MPQPATPWRAIHFSLPVDWHTGRPLLSPVLAFVRCSSRLLVDGFMTADAAARHSYRDALSFSPRVAMAAAALNFRVSRAVRERRLRHRA